MGDNQPKTIPPSTGVWSAPLEVPADVDLLLAVNGAASWRRGELGPALRQVLAPVVGQGEVARAWRRLAEILHLTDEEAFDELVGRRFVLVRRPIGEPGALMDWAVISEVSTKTRRLLADGLRAAPRRIEGGLAVMSVEDGRFWLSAVSGKDRATLLLGPASAPGLFDALSATLGRQHAGALGDPGPLAELRSLDRQATVLLMSRAPGEDGSWFAASARGEGRTLHASVAVRSAELSKIVAEIGPWTRRSFDRLEPGCFFMIEEWRLPALAEWSALGVPLAPLLAAAKRAAPAGEGDWTWGGPRQVLRLAPASDALGALTVAVQSSDIDADAARGDAAIGALVRALAPGAPPDAGALDLRGQFPRAWREVDLSDSLGAAWRSLFDDGPMLVWNSAPDERPRLDGPGAGEDAPGAAPGWWIAGLGQAEAQRVLEELASHAPRDEHKPRPWVALGVLRPRAALEELRRRGVVIPAGIAAAIALIGGVDSVHWSLWRSEAGSVLGELSLTVAPPEAVGGADDAGAADDRR